MKEKDWPPKKKPSDKKKPMIKETELYTNN